MIRFTKIEQQTNNKFLNMYHMDALTKSGKKFDYFFASRNDINTIKPLTAANNPEGIAIFAVYRDNLSSNDSKQSENKVVLIRQYRYPIGDYVYELPAGLVDSGETVFQAAKREMMEETGLSFSADQNNMGISLNPYFMCQGLTDESSVIICGYASGKVRSDLLEDTEDIQVLLVGVDEAQRILGREKVSMRAAFMLSHFCHSYISERNE